LITILITLLAVSVPPDQQVVRNFWVFADCMRGPDREPYTTSCSPSQDYPALVMCYHSHHRTCNARADFDADGDVDLMDYSRLSNSIGVFDDAVITTVPIPWVEIRLRVGDENPNGP
jgi:hypothetical protein